MISPNFPTSTHRFENQSNLYETNLAIFCQHRHNYRRSHQMYRLKRRLSRYLATSMTCGKLCEHHLTKIQHSDWSTLLNGLAVT